MTIIAKKITKQFGEPPVLALKGIDLQIEDGEFVSISGRSGSGKSTLLYILSTLDNPSSGEMLIDGKNPSKMNDRDLHHFRATSVGFIFQFHYLLSELTTLENVLLPARNLGLEKQKKKEAMELLERFDILDQQNKLPGQMSGGQQQRVAIARALIMKPRYIFADEPTGSLDSTNGMIVMNILKEVNLKDKTTVVLVTHEEDYAALARREIFLSDGNIVVN